MDAFLLVVITSVDPNIVASAGSRDEGPGCSGRLRVFLFAVHDEA